MTEATELLRRVAASTIDRTKRELARAVAEALGAAPPVTRAVHVVAVGKSSPLMARAARAAWSSRIATALVVCPDGTAVDDLAGVEVHRSSHPLPDERSVAAAARAFDVAAAVGPDDLLLALVSGGASALAVSGVALEELAAVTRALLRSGAAIGDINTVRRHLSTFAGGGLARAAAAKGGRVVTCVVADVVGDAPAQDVGSGPSVVDPTTLDEARALLWKHAPDFAKLALHESLKPGDPEAARLRTWTVATPELLADVAAGELRTAGFEATHAAPSGAPVEQLAAEYESLAQKLAPGTALVRASEPTVRVTAASPGRGGRSCHLAALVARRLPPGVAFLAAASDGADGESGTGGAVVDASFVARAGGPGVYADRLAAFDTARLHEAAATAIAGAPSGLNLCDLHVLARAEGG